MAEPDAVREARSRAEGVTVFTVHVGRDGGKWVGQCQEVDVQATVQDRDQLKHAVRLGLYETLGHVIRPDQIRFVDPSNG